MTDQVSAIEIAQKQRHAYLLGKIQQNQPLSRPEVEELKRYEMARKSKTTETTVTVAKKKRDVTQSKRVSLAEVKALGLTSENLTLAAAAFTGPGDLPSLIAKRPAVARAWGKGRFLRDLSLLASKMVTVSQAAKKLGLEGLELRKILDADSEAGDLWDSRRLELEVQGHEAILEAAKEGKASAVRYVETFLRDGSTAGSGIDYEHVPGPIMEAITGKSRQTLYTWHYEGRMPRNSDNTYNLVEFVRWFEKAVAAKSRTAPEKTNELQEAKAEKIRIELRQLQGGLLERVAAVNGLVTRMQNFLAAIENFLPATVAACAEAGENLDRIERILRDFCGRIREHIKTVPPELMLPEETAKAFEELLGRLVPKDCPPDEELDQKE